MSETSTRARPSDTDLLLTAVDTMQQVQEEHGTILTNLESRPIPDLTGVERRLEEFADAIYALPQAIPKPHRRPWWLTACLVTLAFLLGNVTCWGIMRTVPHWGMQVVTQPVRIVPAPAIKKGK